MEIAAGQPFTVTFTHQGYAPSAVNIAIQPGEPGVSNPKFGPNPVFVRLAPGSGKKSSTAKPQRHAPDQS
jgi:hypothetical protein